MQSSIAVSDRFTNRRISAELSVMVSPLTPRGMDNRQLDQLIRELGCKIDGAQGQRRFEAFEITMFCVTDELHDRMRVMAPILPVADLENGLLEVCMDANSDRALDAHYCTSEGTNPLSPHLRSPQPRSQQPHLT